VKNQGGSDYLWICEFCGYENDVVLEEGEKPHREHAEYIIKPSANESKQQTHFVGIN
jgi:hypothetical protein